MMAVATAVAASDDVESSRKAGLAALEKGDCREAVAELLRARASGDSSNGLMVRLGQALECQGRVMDAVSASFAEDLSDTTGRIELLIYRADLLRRIGLEDEAKKVDAVLSDAVAATVLASPVHAEKVSLGWSLSGSAGWVYDALSSVQADSVRNLRESQGGIARLDDPNAWRDTTRIAGAQIPLRIEPSLDIDAGRHFLSIGVPATLTLPTDFSDWLSAGVGTGLMGFSSWNDRFSSWFAASAVRTWYRREGADPTWRTDLSGQLGASARSGRLKLSTNHSVAGAWDGADAYAGLSGGHGIGAGVSLPWRFGVDLGAGFSWFVNDARTESYAIPGATVLVEGAEAGISNQDESLRFLDTNGTPIRYSNPLWMRRLPSGGRPEQWVETGVFLYPDGNNGDYGRWNLGATLSQTPYSGFSWSAGVDFARTEWNREWTVCLVDYADLEASYQDHQYQGANALFFYRDRATGEEFWVANTGNSRLVPRGALVEKRRRKDRTMTVSVALKYRWSRVLSAVAGASWIRNESSLERFVSGTSYNRTLWNLTGSVTW